MQREAAESEHSSHALIVQFVTPWPHEIGKKKNIAGSLEQLLRTCEVAVRSEADVSNSFIVNDNQVQSKSVCAAQPWMFKLQ